MSRTATPTNLAALILIAALAALPVVAALPARAGGFGGTGAQGQISPLPAGGLQASDDGEVRDLAGRLQPTGSAMTLNGGSNSTRD